MTRLTLLVLLLPLLLVAACQSSPTPTAAPVERPTTNPFFSSGTDEPAALGGTPAALGTPLGAQSETTPGSQAAQTDGDSSASGAAPTVTATLVPSPTPTVTPRSLVRRYIFEDNLNENWSLENTHWMTVTRQTDLTHSGVAALQFTPYEDFGSLFFTVSDDANREYPRPQVAGLVFWINAGSDPLRPEDLAVTVVGSNEYTYWVPGDYSVQSNIQPTFSETRLSFLGLGRDVPPGEWVRIEVRLNELQYDPPYRYVTGFYIKNDRGVLHPFYVDDIALIMAEAEDE